MHPPKYDVKFKILFGLIGAAAGFCVIMYFVSGDSTFLSQAFMCIVCCILPFILSYSIYLRDLKAFHEMFVRQYGITYEMYLAEKKRQDMIREDERKKAFLAREEQRIQILVADMSQPVKRDPALSYVEIVQEAEKGNKVYIFLTHCYGTINLSDNLVVLENGKSVPFGKAYIAGIYYNNPDEISSEREEQS